MKKLLLIICWILILAGGIRAQNIYHYDYDAAGNRIRRLVLILKKEGVPGGANSQQAGPSVLDDGNMRLYPNPTQGVVVFETTDGGDVTQYRLSDAGGKLIETERAASSPLRLDLSDHPAGVYLLEVILKKERKYYKIIKQ